MKKILTSELGQLLPFTCALIVCTLIIGAIGVSSAIAADNEAKITIVFDHALPNVPGKSMKGVLVEYAPGGTSPAHMHPKSAFIYATVLEGAIQSAVNDGPSLRITPGKTGPRSPATDTA